MKRVVRNAKVAKRETLDGLSGAWATLRDRLAEALGLLTTLNFERRHARFVLDEGTILAVIDLPGEPFVPDHFVESFLTIASSASVLPKSLEKVLGGRMPSEPKAPRSGGRGRKELRRR